MPCEIDEDVRYITNRIVQVHPHENSHAGSAVATGDELRSAWNQLLVFTGRYHIYFLRHPFLFVYWLVYISLQAIRSGEADVTMLDAGDIYTAGLNFDLIPILSEVYNLGKPEYYVVAVAKARDADTELIYLKNKNTCHTGN